jgi:hypothetical protein
MVLFRNSGTPVAYIFFDAEIHLQFIHRDVISNLTNLPQINTFIAQEHLEVSC